MRVRFNVGVIEIVAFMIEDNNVYIRNTSSVVCVSTDKELIDNFNDYSENLLKNGYIDLSKFNFDIAEV